MKKSLLLICLLFSITSFSFADIMFQSDLETASGIFIYEKNCFDYEEPDIFYPGFIPVSGFNLSAIYEFNTRDLSDWHYFTGLNVGFELLGIDFSLLGGFSYKLTEFNRTRMELTTTLGLGYEFLIFGPSMFYTQLSADLIFCGASRIGLYGGIGIANYSILNLSNYREFGWKNMILDSICLRLVAGLRL